MQRVIFSSNRLPARAIAFSLVFAMVISLSLSDLSRANAIDPAIAALKAVSISIPSELGHVEEFFQGRGNRLVVYIQDAHANYSAQKHIASAIDHFSAQYNIPLVALEAADGEVDVNLFRSFPVPEITEKVLDKRMRTGEIGGPEFALTMSRKNIDAVGVDDEELYLKNFKEFMSVMDKKKEGLEFVKNVRTAFQSLRSATYSKEHKELDRILEAHRQETLDVMTLMKELRKFAVALKADTKTFPEIQKLTEILRRSAPQNDKPGVILSEAKDLDHIDEKTIHEYMENIDAEALFLDIERLALMLKLKMSGTNTERRLITLEHYLNLLERGFELTLARRDVKELNELAKEMRAERIFSFLEKAAEENRVLLGSLNSVRDIPIDNYVERILAFYGTTVKRDEHFAKALLVEMEKKRASSALMIAGGYHRQGLTERLRKQKISYVVVMPKVDEVSEHEKYLELMKKGADLLHLPTTPNKPSLRGAPRSRGVPPRNAGQDARPTRTEARNDTPVIASPEGAKQSTSSRQTSQDSTLGFGIRAAPSNAMIGLTGPMFNDLLARVSQPESAVYFQTHGFGSLQEVVGEYTHSGRFVFYNGNRVGDRSLFREMLRRSANSETPSSSAGFGKILERASFSVNISDPSVLNAIKTAQNRLLQMGPAGFGAADGAPRLTLYSDTYGSRNIQFSDDEWDEAVRNHWSPGVDYDRLFGDKHLVVIGDTNHGHVGVQRGFIEHLEELKVAGVTHLALEIPSDDDPDNISEIAQKTWIPHRFRQLYEKAHSIGLKIVFVDMSVADQKEIKSEAERNHRRGIKMGENLAALTQRAVGENPKARVAAIVGYGHFEPAEIPDVLQREGVAHTLVGATVEGQSEIFRGEELVAFVLPVSRAVVKYAEGRTYGYIDLSSYDGVNVDGVIHYARPSLEALRAQELRSLPAQGQGTHTTALSLTDQIRSISRVEENQMATPLAISYADRVSPDVYDWSVTNRRKIADFVARLDGISMGQKIYLYVMLAAYAENTGKHSLSGSIVDIGFVPEGQFFEISTVDTFNYAYEQGKFNEKRWEVSLRTLQERFGFSDLIPKDMRNIPEIHIRPNPNKRESMVKIFLLALAHFTHPERIALVPGYARMKIFYTDASKRAGLAGEGNLTELEFDDFQLNDIEHEFEKAQTLANRLHLVITDLLYTHFGIAEQGNESDIREAIKNMRWTVRKKAARAYKTAADALVNAYRPHGGGVFMRAFPNKVMEARASLNFLSVQQQTELIETLNRSLADLKKAWAALSEFHHRLPQFGDVPGPTRPSDVFHRNLDYYVGYDITNLTAGRALDIAKDLTRELEAIRDRIKNKAGLGNLLPTSEKPQLPTGFGAASFNSKEGGVADVETGWKLLTEAAVHNNFSEMKVLIRAQLQVLKNVRTEARDSARLTMYTRYLGEGDDDIRLELTHDVEMAYRVRFIDELLDEHSELFIVQTQKEKVRRVLEMNFYSGTSHIESSLKNQITDISSEEVGLIVRRFAEKRIEDVLSVNRMAYQISKAGEEADKHNDHSDYMAARRFIEENNSLRRLWLGEADLQPSIQSLDLGTKLRGVSDPEMMLKLAKVHFRDLYDIDVRFYFRGGAFWKDEQDIRNWLSVKPLTYNIPTIKRIAHYLVKIDREIKRLDPAVLINNRKIRAITLVKEGRTARNITDEDTIVLPIPHRGLPIFSARRTFFHEFGHGVVLKGETADRLFVFSGLTALEELRDLAEKYAVPMPAEQKYGEMKEFGIKLLSALYKDRLQKWKERQSNLVQKVMYGVFLILRGPMLMFFGSWHFNEPYIFHEYDRLIPNRLAWYSPLLRLAFLFGFRGAYRTNFNEWVAESIQMHVLHPDVLNRIDPEAEKIMGFLVGNGSVLADAQRFTAGFGSESNKEARKNFPSRRTVLIGGGAAAAAVASLGIGWYLIEKWTTEEWQRFEPEPTLESAKEAVLATIDWLKDNGFPDAAMLDRYAKAVKEGTDVIPPGQQDNVLASMFQKMKISGGKVTVNVNSQRVYKYFRALQKIGSMDLFLEVFASLIVQEAAGLDLMSVDDVENDEVLKVGKHIYVDELRKHFSGGRIEWPSKGLFEFLNKYPGEIQMLATMGLAGEYHEMRRRSKFLAWAKQKSLYSPEKAEKEFQQMRLQKETADSFNLFNAYRPITKELLATSGREDEILALAMRQTLSAMLLRFERGEYSAKDWIHVSRYGFFAYLEFERYRATRGAQGIDEKLLGLLQQGKLPPRAMLQNTAQRLLPQVKTLISVWENRLKALEKQSSSGFGAGRKLTRMKQKLWRQRIERISIAALSWFAGVVPGLMGGKLSTWLGLAAVSGCVGGCGSYSYLLEYGSPVDYALHYINVALVRSWGPSQILDVNGHEVAIYDKYPDHLKNFRFSKIELQIIRDKLAKKNPDDLYKLRWIAAVPNQVDLWGQAFGDGFVLIMEDAPADDEKPRAIVGHEKAEELKRAGKSIASEKAIMGFENLAEVVEHEFEHLLDDDDPLWEELHRLSGDDLDNYVREYGMTNQWEDRATVAEAWVRNSAGQLMESLKKATLGKTILFQKFLLIMKDRVFPNGVLRAYGPVLNGFVTAEDWAIEAGSDGWIQVGPFRIKLNEQNEITGVVGVGENELLGDVITGKWNFDHPVSSTFIEEIVQGDFEYAGELNPDPTLPTIDPAWISDSLYKFEDALYFASTLAQDPDIPKLLSILETMRLFVDSENGTLRAYEWREDGTMQPRDWKLSIVDTDVIRIKTEANEFELHLNANGEIVSASFRGPSYRFNRNGEIVNWTYDFDDPIASPFIEVVLNSNAERIQISASPQPSPLVSDEISLTEPVEIPLPEGLSETFFNLGDAIAAKPELEGIDFPFPAVSSKDPDGQVFNPSGHPYGSPHYNILVKGSEVAASITGMYTDATSGPGNWFNNRMYSVVWYRASPDHEPLVFQFDKRIISLEINEKGELVIHTTSPEPIVIDVKSQSKPLERAQGVFHTEDEMLAEFPYLSEVLKELPQEGNLFDDGTIFSPDIYRVYKLGNRIAVASSGDANGYDNLGNWITREFHSSVVYVFNIEDAPGEFSVHDFGGQRVVGVEISNNGQVRLDIDFSDQDIFISPEGQILETQEEPNQSGFGSSKELGDTDILPNVDESEVVQWNVEQLSSREFYKSGQSIGYSHNQKNPEWREYVVQVDDDGKIIGYGAKWRGKGEIILYEHLDGRIRPAIKTDPSLLTLAFIESLGVFSELKQNERAVSRPLLDDSGDQVSLEEEVTAAESQMEADRSSVLHASPTGLPAIVEESEPIGVAGFGLENGLPQAMNDVDTVAALVARMESREMLAEAVTEAENAGLFDRRFALLDFDALLTLEANPDVAERFRFDHVAILGFSALSKDNQVKAKEIISTFWGEAEFIERSVKSFSADERTQLSVSRLLPLFTLRKPADFKGDWVVLKVAINEDILAIPGDVRAAVDFVIREAISNLLNVLAIRRTVGMAA